MRWTLVSTRLSLPETNSKESVECCVLKIIIAWHQVCKVFYSHATVFLAKMLKKCNKRFLATLIWVWMIILRPYYLEVHYNWPTTIMLLQVLQHAKPLNQLPLVGSLFTPPVNVTAVAKVAVRAATDPVFPPGIIDVYGILRYSQQKSK